ncbi:MobP3 family relaxase [Pelotomaculum sp. PtaB.Bin117]|uniref:MobP3 family relaxase n=1 Tax=Pelotomaculum sp. PtaB.Bin117 TaxID=1811694 RepID=UPI0009D5EFD7|nr:MobP3 family relaxase [Pelotomaculum sp. PtaB.Bin117]OPX92223.1 MAG: Beta-lactamase HcpA precursor [Pelotomaculum sp. PtaB.Bin117]
MPRLIFKCRYLKNAPEHLANFIEYAATREGVEKVPDSTGLLPATKKQQRLIAEIISKLPDTAGLFEYEDYLKDKTRENASEFIAVALEQNLDLLGKRENYVGYIANRPGAEALGSHGLFTDADLPVVLSKVAEEVANHAGNVWTNVISLRREDAARLGYDNAKAWRDLIRGQRNHIAEQMKIAPENLRWYAAYHNEGHHPHVHLIAYSINPTEAYLTKQGIENMRSSLAREIFKQDLIQIYSEQTKRRDALTRQSRESMREIIGQISSGVCENKTIEELIARLAERLKHTSGKKKYGYLKAPLKAVVDRIVDELARDERVARCYEKWCELRNEVLRTYADRLPEPLPLSRRKEFKSIKNMVIAEAMSIGGHHFTFEPDEDMETDLYLAGEDIPKDVSAAAAYFEKTARLGNVHAQYVLARLYLTGEDMPKDVLKAVELLAKSAMQNNSFAQYRLGKLYMLGKDVPKDVDEAVKWLTASSEQGNQYAQYALGKLYLMGHEVPRNREAAVRWLSLSAGQGNIYAQFFLDHVDSFREPSVLMAATRLMHHLGNIFRNEQKRFGGGVMQVDRKLRKKLAQKKAAQGHAHDDREPRQSY